MRGTDRLVDRVVEEIRKRNGLSREPRRVEAACPHCRGEKRCPCAECVEGLGEVDSGPCRVCGGKGATRQWVQ